MEDQVNLNHFISQAEPASWPFFAVATILFGMRTVSRIFYTEGAAGWEDFIITLSWLFDVVRMVTFQLALSATRRLSHQDLPGTAPNAVFWSLFTCSWAFLSITLPKVGVAFLLIRIFRPRPWVRVAIMGSALGLFIICIVGFVICFVQCDPVPGQWNPYKYPETKCWPRHVQIRYALFGSSCSAALDMAFAIYPGVVIWKLQLPTWKKASTIGFMGLGVAAFAFAVVKVNSNGYLLGDPDLIELLTKALKIGLWNSIENDFVMIAACLPAVRPLFKAFGIFTQTHLSTSKSTRMSSHTESQNSLKRNSSTDTSFTENEVELGMKKSFPQAIHVQRDISLQREKTAVNHPELPVYNFKISHEESYRH